MTFDPPEEQPDPGLPTDASLLRQFRDGREDAATDLYDRYAQRLVLLARAQSSPSLASRFDPEDVVQSVFRTFFRRVREGQYDIPHDEELWGLFLVITLNKIRKLGAYHRAGKRDVRMTTHPETMDQPGANRILDRQRTYDMLRTVVQDILTGLPETQQRIVTYRIEGHDIASIARHVRRSKRTVERTLQNFRTTLSELIHE